MTDQRVFKDTRFMTAGEKVQVIRAWERFIKGGFGYKSFTQALYHHLTLHCSFIAHFDRAGFYSTYFEDPEATIRFLHQFDLDHGHRSVEYGYAGWLTQEEYSDINGAMCSAFEPLRPGLYAMLQKKAREKDAARARQLLEKMGMGELAMQVR
jgi:hypothetical protein